ncbi:MAG: hypothetical protein H0W63_02330 [Gemmatimonadaceae bacterium]|nr:hypothetical protein [Gemmatimonadaceae bacterium]
MPPTPPNAVKRAALAAIVASIVAILIGYAAAFVPGGAPPWAPWLLAIGIPASIGGIVVLGASRGSSGAHALTIPIVFVTATLAIGFSLALALPANESATSTLWLGLPARAAILVYGIGILPAVVLPVAYALTFDAHTLSAEDVDRVKRMAADRE